MEENIFEKASRCKLRFATQQGSLLTEDLWDLPLTSTKGRLNLDDLARFYHRVLREEGEVISFVEPAREVDVLPKLQLDILKHIIAAKIAENQIKAQASYRREQKQRLLELIDSKKNEELAGKSLEELMAMVNEL